MYFEVVHYRRVRLYTHPTSAVGRSSEASIGKFVE